MRIRKGDVVQVITGDDRGSTGRVLRVLRDENKIVVEGCNMVHKHIRPSQRNPRGGRLTKEMPIHVSNVLLVSPETGAGVRVGARIDSKGDKVLYCKKTGKEIRVIKPAKHETVAKEL